MHVVFAGTFALSPKSTMRARALPLAAALQRRGHRVSMVLPPWDNPSDSGASAEIDGVPILNLKLPPGLPLVWYGLLAGRMLMAVSALKPDAVHAFKPKGFSGAAAQGLLARRRVARGGPRVVVDTDDWEGAGGWNEKGGYPWWMRRVFDYQERSLLRTADAVTAASRLLQYQAEARRDGRGGVFYVPNGTAGRWPEPDPQRVCRLRERLDLGGRPVLLLYTRFVECPPARIALLLGEVARRRPECTLLLVGAGMNGEEQEFLQRLGSQVPGLPVVNAGWVAPEELPLYFRLAAAAVFPMDDTLINRAKCSAKLIDLLSAGLPVVAEAVGQCREYIRDGESGVLVKPGDPDGVGSAVAGLLEDPERCERLGGAAQQTMETRFKWDLLAATLEEAYQA